MLLQDELTISMLNKCKESQPVLQRIVQSTNDDESLLFEALNLNDELQQVISKFEEMQASRKSDVQEPEVPKDSQSVDAPSAPMVEVADADKSWESLKVEDTKSSATDVLDDGAESSRQTEK